MKTTVTGFDVAATLHKLHHYLPAQNPLKDFVHHNTLHAFQDKNFDIALQEASEVFGYKTYLSLVEFRAKYHKGEIKKAFLEQAIASKNNLNSKTDWLNLALTGEFSEEVNARIGVLRSYWKTNYAINLDKANHTLLFKFISSYLDQGVAIWNFPDIKEGFLATILTLEEANFSGIFKSKRVKDLAFSNPTIEQLLHLLVGDEVYFEQYLFDQQFAHPGWSGMVATLEHNPVALLDQRKVSLNDFIVLELLLEIDALDNKFDGHWEPLALSLKSVVPQLFNESKSNDYFTVLALWQEAAEWSLYDLALANISKANFVEKKTPLFQAAFCMDDREGSLRRNIEEVEPKASTFGTAAFFNFEFYFQPVDGKFHTKSCPAPLSPAYLIKELPRAKKHAKDFYLNKKSHNLLTGWLSSQLLGFSAALKLFLNIFNPKMTAATNASFKHMHKNANLLIENLNGEKQENLQLGFTIEEMADRVDGMLKSIGLVNHFAPLVYIVGHGATSLNNTHYAGYDCGACSGRPSSVNARVFCYAANHPKVRAILQGKGVNIPNATQFIPALHDTTRDEIAFYDEVILNAVNHSFHKENQKVFLEGLAKNAKERSRKFDTIQTNKNQAEVHKNVKKRSVSLFEPRPELNHATNALCIVGRRGMSENLFLDRRAFLNSYDYLVDPTGDYLAGILGAVAPVGGGINLEYYFSRVDNEKLGAGSKLPHNVIGLIGVANGVDGDLRPGLPSQMIEIHDPLRLLVVVEHTPEVAMYAIKKNPNTYNWFEKEWVILVVCNPETGELLRFKNGGFIPYYPISTVLSFDKNQLWNSAFNTNLPLAVLN